MAKVVPNKLFPIPFPTAGVARGMPYSAQPAGTCRDASNARSFDELSKRRRGGQRCGLAKWYPSLVQDYTPGVIQDLNSVTFADDGVYGTPPTGFIPGAPGGTPNAPLTVPYGQVFDPNNNGGPNGVSGPWYLQSRLCSSGAQSGLFLEWGAAGITGGTIQQGSVKYRFNYFDPVVASPGTLHAGYTPTTGCDSSTGASCPSCDLTYTATIVGSTIAGSYPINFYSNFSGLGGCIWGSRVTPLPRVYIGPPNYGAPGTPPYTWTFNIDYAGGDSEQWRGTGNCPNSPASWAFYSHSGALHGVTAVHVT